ncbi:MAG: hypothetical protein KJ614_00065 [Gammaproteobacteria bacterium]|uniref:hypothetical protein n=1 Tax=Rhodoferax sp. TaxID=50421 RepID=UPI00183F5E09|nr:hypothetical protein [Rhodoferax sp.]MBU3897319.1 hypothetical protein [Gammaproteobacteria bacterium]MBA3057222.1 hypothetical protein [Rhodoferax sp.]MBU3998287.1 hypothetical protein [Gammaproteobacteria bacterium]MBU4018665.1 hypothetical protein [Gammaproteobacteria bacterium]MBU4079620.1 hypothetical protein [Gammaproteobacteria bacterium]
MEKGPSIFDRESTKLGRPLNVIDKVRVVSKYTFISSLLVLIPFLLFDYWDIGRLYDNPEDKVFENIKFEVKRAPKGSEARVGLYSNGAQIFSSSCYGIEADVCNKKDFWKPSLAKVVRVIEISPNKGIIKSVAVSTPSGDHVFTNSEADNYVKNYSKRTYRKDWILLLISAVAGIIFFASSLLSHTNRKGK